MDTQTVEVIPGPGVFDNEKEIKTRIELVKMYTDWIQIDITDGIFVPSQTPLDTKIYKEILSHSSAVNFELHMMTKDPLFSVSEWIEAGFKRIIFHIEAVKELTNKQLTDLKNKGIEVGLAIDRDTPCETVFPFLDSIDCVLVMTIKAGYSGQVFMPELLEKVKIIRAKKPALPVEVDGGINEETGKLAVENGATRLAATTYIFNSENIQKAIWTLKNLKK